MEFIDIHQISFSPVFTFTYSGVLSPEATGVRLYNDTGKRRKFDYIRGSLGTPSTGSYVRVDVLKNGVSIFGPHSFLSLEIPEGENTALVSPESTYSSPSNPLFWEPEEYLTVSIINIGSDFPGEDLTINVVVSE